jgi:hypothetical protein
LSLLALWRESSFRARTKYDDQKLTPMMCPLNVRHLTWLRHVHKRGPSASQKVDSNSHELCGHNESDAIVGSGGKIAGGGIKCDSKGKRDLKDLKGEKNEYGKGVGVDVDDLLEQHEGGRGWLLVGVGQRGGGGCL